MRQALTATSRSEQPNLRTRETGDEPMKEEGDGNLFMPRRKFLQMSAVTMGTVGSLSALPGSAAKSDQRPRQEQNQSLPLHGRPIKRPFNSSYFGSSLDMVA